MKTALCSKRDILHPSTLLDFSYEIGPYYGCEHHCRYCYGLNKAESDWDETILIHDNYAGQLASELTQIEPQTIFVGMDTDPYQPIEQSCRHTRETLRLFSERGFSACVLTKSDLVTRDIDLLARMPGSSVGVSVAFQDEATRLLFETAAPPNERRVRALRKARKAGVETYALISPVMPLLTDVEALIDMLRPYADTIWVYRIDLDAADAPNWKNIAAVLSHHMPKAAGEFQEIAFARDHSYWRHLRDRLKAIEQSDDIKLRVFV